MNQDKNNLDKSHPLYEKLQKIYPREVHGLFALWRVTGVIILLGFYYGAPWLRWQNHQAILLDLPERKFHIFALTFWPQDFFYFAILLIAAALALFFFTALAGRIWCGYACPQTVWTEVFLVMERWIEGDRMKQMKLDQSAFGAEKFLKKFSKHALWIIFSIYTGFTFVGYFTPITGLTEKIYHLSLGPWETFWIVFYSFATYGNAGWMREQVCLYMCPYARFQSAMFDKDTLIIAYDEKRGEPRGSRNKKSDYRAKDLGDCINCTLCVQACPTGIDIRDGLQYQCIACAACIDVCNEVMEKMDYEPGLIQYTTENAAHGKPTHLFRPRTIIYGVILLALLSGLGIAIFTRLPLELDVIRDRNTLYRELPDGLIENVYILKVINMDSVQHEYQLTVDGIENMKMKMKMKKIVVRSGEVIELPIVLQVSRVALSKRSSIVEFKLVAKEKSSLTVTEEARFLGPIPVH